MRASAYRIAWLIWVACATPLAAQLDKAQQTLDRVLANPKADTDIRYALLVDAFQLAEAAEGSGHERRTLIEEIKDHLEILDPQALKRLKAQSKTAKALLKSAKSYQDAGWNRTAARVLKLALMLDPHVEPHQVAALREKMPKANQTLLEFFDGATYPYGGKPWEVKSGWIASPIVDPNATEPQSYLLQAQPILSGNYDIQLEVMMGNQPGTLGIAVGITGRGKEYHMVQLEFSDARSTLSVHAYQSSRFSKKISKTVELSPKQRGTWVPVHIKVSDRVLSADVGGLPAITWEAEWTLDGSIGLFITGYTRNPDPVRFRNLHVEGRTGSAQTGR